MFLWFLISSVSANIVGTGSATFISLLHNWFDAYSSIKPDVNVQYTITSANSGIQSIINGTPYSDFAAVDSVKPSSSAVQINPNFQLIPIITSTFVVQINIVAIQNSPFPLALTREALADIFLGNITNWRDPRILASNPQLISLLPNANITVIYRTDATGANTLWTTLLSSFSPTWKKLYGVNSSFPTYLTGLKNFKGGSGNLKTNGKVLGLDNSIGYSTFAYVVRDSGIQYACIVNILGYTVCPNATTIAAAISATQLAASFLSNNISASYFAIEVPLPNAYPIATYLALMVSTRPSASHCDDLNNFYRFVKWILTDTVPRQQTAEAGYAPLSPAVTDLVLSTLAKIECNGKSVLASMSLNTRGVLHKFLLFLTSLVFLFVLFLSALHFYQFRASVINLVYTAVFVAGAIITLGSPYVWYLIPTNSVCQARIWLSSMGLTILLGTMFSRTWQLRDIYLLQKRKTGMDKLSRNITVRSSLVKLVITLVTVTLTNLLLLAVWNGVDPYTAQYNIVDTLNLDGRWKCTSTHMLTWVILELVFLMGLISFGVYVIYFTWSFQRQALIAETRWVLIALYNIILNLTAIIPVAIISLTDDDDGVVLMMISLMFSGGGIVMAFLLPRSIQKLLGESAHDSDSPAGTAVGSAEKGEKGSTGTGQKAMKSAKKEMSRTPVEELSLRLENPRRGYSSPDSPEPDDDVNKNREKREIELLTIRQSTIPNSLLNTMREDDEPKEHTGIQRLEENLVMDPLSSSASYYRGTYSVPTTPVQDPNYVFADIPTAGETPILDPRTLSWSSNPLSAVEDVAEEGM